MFQKSRGVFFSEVAKAPQAAATQPRSVFLGSVHAIVTSNKYTDTLQVYRHPTSIQTPYKHTDILQVYITQNTSPDTQIQVQTLKIQSKHPKYNSRHPNTSPDTKIQVQTSKIHIQVSNIHIPNSRGMFFWGRRSTTGSSDTDAPCWETPKPAKNKKI